LLKKTENRSLTSLCENFSAEQRARLPKSFDAFRSFVIEPLSAAFAFTLAAPKRCSLHFSVGSWIVRLLTRAVLCWTFLTVPVPKRLC